MFKTFKLLEFIIGQFQHHGHYISDNFFTSGACFISLQSVTFTTTTKQSSWTNHPMSLMPFFWIDYQISYTMTAVTDITLFGHYLLHGICWKVCEFMDLIKAFSLLNYRFKKAMYQLVFGYILWKRSSTCCIGQKKWHRGHYIL